jgi:hydroxyisourate hydrolase
LSSHFLFKSRQFVYISKTMPAKLTTHVLDLASGRPAAGMRMELWRHGSEGTATMVKTAATNAEGRTDLPLLGPGEIVAGTYEIVFLVGDFFDKSGGGGNVRFLDRVPVRFGISDAGASYHVPLLVTPWSYSTYRGS